MPQVLLGVLDGATVKGRQVAQGSLPGTAVATTNVSLWAEFLVTVTGNTSYTWDAAYGVETVVAATNIHYGGPNNTTANDAWGGFVFEIWNPMPLPTNMDVTSIDTNGRLDIIKVAGTTQTARDIGASVLLSSGTGAGQLDFTSGVVKANLAQILGTALTETAGQIAAAFKQFFNIASPTSTMNVITTVTTATNLTNAPTSGDLTATMKTSVTAAVLDADMTGHQTQGTLGQAIGDPAADTNTIYKAVVTDATGATVGVDVVAVKAETASIQTDTNDIQARIPAALSGDGFMKADLKSIEDDLTSGNNAVLKLKSLDLRSTTSVNPLYIDASGAATAAVVVQASGVDAEGVSVSGDAIGVDIGGNSHALGLYSTSGKSIDAPNDIAVSDGDLTLAAIAAAVWANATRTLSSFGTLIADIWTYVTRTITGGTITTNSDKTGYSLTSAYDSAKTASQDSDMVVVLANVVPLTFDSDSYVLSHPMTSVVVGTNGDKTGYSLTSAYDPAKTASQDSDMFDVLGYVSGLTFDSDSKVFANAAVSLTSDDIQSIVDALSFPTADENATTLLKYDLSTVTGEAARSPLNALRKLRNKVSFATGTLSIKKEDDVTNAYTQAVTQDSDQEPFKSIG
jgi:hypothetical protein